MHYVVIVAGVLLFANGLSIDAKAESAMHQIYAANFEVGGIVVIAIGLLIVAINRVGDKLKAPKSESDGAYTSSGKEIKPLPSLAEPDRKKW